MGNLCTWIMSLGICYAQLEEIEKAEKQLVILQSYETTLSEYEDIEMRSPIHIYHQAQVLTALGRKEAGIEVLKEAKERGVTFMPARWGYDIFLKPLFGDPAFEELVKQEGRVWEFRFSKKIPSINFPATLWEIKKDNSPTSPATPPSCHHVSLPLSFQIQPLI